MGSDPKRYRWSSHGDYLRCYRAVSGIGKVPGYLVFAFPFSQAIANPRRSAVGAGRVQRHGGADKSLQCFLVNLLAFVEVDGAPGVAFEAGVEEA